MAYSTYLSIGQSLAVQGGYTHLGSVSSFIRILHAILQGRELIYPFLASLNRFVGFATM